MSSVYLVALKICSTFRTTSGKVVLMLMGMISANFLGREMIVLHYRAHMEKNTELRNAESHDRCESKWKESLKCKWTHKLVASADSQYN